MSLLSTGRALPDSRSPGRKLGLASDAEPQTAFMACPDFTGQGGRPVELRHLNPKGPDEGRLGGRRRRLLASWKQ